MQDLGLILFLEISRTNSLVNKMQIYDVRIRWSLVYPGSSLQHDSFHACCLQATRSSFLFTRSFGNCNSTNRMRLVNAGNSSASDIASHNITWHRIFSNHSSLSATFQKIASPTVTGNKQNFGYLSWSNDNRFKPSLRLHYFWHYFWHYQRETSWDKPQEARCSTIEPGDGRKAWQ